MKWYNEPRIPHGERHSMNESIDNHSPKTLILATDYKNPVQTEDQKGARKDRPCDLGLYLGHYCQ
jgi:hypothetical protein